MEFEPSIMSDDGFEDKSTRDPEKRPEEAEAIDDEIDPETDTEHKLQGGEDQGATDEVEGEEADEVEQTCRPNSGIDERIRERMNRLAVILKRRRVTENQIAEQGEQARQRRAGREAELEQTDDDKKLEELETLLNTFEDDEVRSGVFAEGSLESPVLLILAQHRSFRICRRKFSCMEENCREQEKIKTPNKYVTHMQKCHEVTQKETMDMMSYVIRKFIPGPVEAIVRTDGGARVRGDRQLHRCHSAECSYVNGRSVRAEKHVKRNHSEMTKDIKALGWF
jgi:hypothetical protein